LPIIATYYYFNIGFVSISVGFSVCVLNFHFRGPRKSKVPKWLKKILFIEENKSIKILNKTMNLVDFNDRKSPIKTKLIDECNIIESDSPSLIALASLKDDISDKYDLRELDKVTSKDHILEKILSTIKESLDALQTTASFVITDNILNEWKLVAIRIDHILFTISCFITFFTPLFLFGKYFAL
jgi:hypothetical protein